MYTFLFPVQNASLGGGRQGRVIWRERDAVADHTRPESYGAHAEPYGWQVAVAVAVVAIVLSNYHDMSLLLRRVAFTVGACACACQCARVRVSAGLHSQIVRSHRAPCHI